MSLDRTNSSQITKIDLSNYISAQFDRRKTTTPSNLKRESAEVLRIPSSMPSKETLAKSKFN